MKSNYEERKANRIDAYTGLAAKNEKLSDDSFKRSHELGNVLPFGQPILVGHHSEKKHRALISKITSTMDAGMAASKKSEYYADKAQSIINNTSISSDDPTALEQLETKLAGLQKAQELYKSINKICRDKKLDEAGKFQSLMNIGIKGNTAIQVLTPVYNSTGIPQYKLTNNNANMATIKKRITSLQAVAQIEAGEETIGDVRLIMNQEDNRVQIDFGYKPNEKIRAELKASGFKFAFSTELWQNYLNKRSIYNARLILNAVAVGAYD